MILLGSWFSIPEKRAQLPNYMVEAQKHMWMFPTTWARGAKDPRLESCDFLKKTHWSRELGSAHSCHTIPNPLVPSLILWPGPKPSSGALAAENQSLPAASEGPEKAERATLEASHVLTSFPAPPPNSAKGEEVRMCLPKMRKNYMTV